jgi:hypothetical protein
MHWEFGHKAVEEFKVGDRLYARDEFDPSGPIELKAIEEVFVRQLKELLDSCSSRSMRESLSLAIESLNARNPFLFDPNFHDLENVWRLDRTKFRDHIGPL